MTDVLLSVWQAHGLLFCAGSASLALAVARFWHLYSVSPWVDVLAVCAVLLLGLTCVVSWGRFGVYTTVLVALAVVVVALFLEMLFALACFLWRPHRAALLPKTRRTVRPKLLVYIMALLQFFPQKWRQLKRCFFWWFGWLF